WLFTALNLWTGSLCTGFNSRMELHLNRGSPGSAVYDLSTARHQSYKGFLCRGDVNWLDNAARKAAQPSPGTVSTAPIAISDASFKTEFILQYLSDPEFAPPDPAQLAQSRATPRL